MAWDGLTDRPRHDLALTGPHTALARVELWTAHGELITEDAPHESFTVDDQWVTGIRRSLSLTVAQTDQWREWLGRPDLVIRPYHAVTFGANTTTEWIPMGRFIVRQRPWSLQPGPVQVRGTDYWSHVVGYGFLPSQGYRGLIKDSIEQLILSTNPYQFVVTNTASSAVVAPPVAWTQKRSDTIAQFCKAIGAEAFVDREGQFQVRDRRYRWPVVTLKTGAGGTIGDVTETVDLSGVVNIVRAVGSNTEAVFEPALVFVEDPADPAHHGNLGGHYTEEYVSPLLMTRDQAFVAARTVLNKRKESVRSLSIACVPNPVLDAGDAIYLIWPNGLQEFVVIKSINHPHPSSSDPQIITTVSSLGPDDD